MINDTTSKEDLKYLYKYYNTNRVHSNTHPYKRPDNYSGRTNGSPVSVMNCANVKSEHRVKSSDREKTPNYKCRPK